MALLTSRKSNARATGAWRRRVAWLAGLILLGCAIPASAQPETSTEYQLKAAFLFKLAQFFEWPARAFHEASSPLVIGVLGEDPFGTYFDEFVKGEKVGARPLIVRRFNRVEDIAECHILFISRSEAGTLDKSLAQLHGRSMLTIGDTDTFTKQGGMVRLYLESQAGGVGKIRFKINVEATKAAELTPSSTILSPTTIARPGTD